MIFIQGINKEIPTSYSEVDFQTYIELMKAGSDTVKVLSIFTGKDEETIKKARIKNLHQVLQLLSFVSQETIDMTVPKQVAGYLVPEDLNFETIAQFSDAQEVMKSYKHPAPDGPDNHDELVKLAEMCAIFAYPKDKEYDYKEAAKLIPVFMKAPCREVLALGNFILLKSITLRLGTAMPSLKPLTRMKKLRLAFRTWRANLAFTIRYALWKRRLRTGGMNLPDGQ